MKSIYLALQLLVYNFDLENNYGLLDYDFNYNDTLKVISFLENINEGKKIIYETCEYLDGNYNLIYGEIKPKCQYNVSFLNNSFIHIDFINQDLKEFFLEKKKEYCYKQDIICGKLTILNKLIDIINFSVFFSKENQHFYEFLINLKIINFKENYDFYINSLDDINIITNITLANEYGNIYLQKEKLRLYKEKHRTYVDKIVQSINIYISEPIYDCVNNFVCSSTTIIKENMPALSFEYKIILIMVLYIIIKKI